ncbi:MAG: hypothetical protein AAF725_05860 [Acidobacteriota bacterium]
MRRLFVFVVLLVLRTYSRVFYRQESLWVGPEPAEKWPPYTLVAILNHTSLCEYLLSGQVPLGFIWRMAGHCTLPVAEETMKRPVVGLFWRMVAANPISITRERDNTWQQVMESIQDPDSMIMLLPEGRMKRGDGLDKNGRPMTMRSGIGDLIRGLEGNMLFAYSQGLHHIQVPGGGLPKHFKPVRVRYESMQISEYRALMAEGLDLSNDRQYLRFKRRMKEDLEARRDLHCTSDRGGTDQPEAWGSAHRAPIR